MAYTRMAVIGCGAIASRIVDAVASGLLSYHVTGLLDIRPERCRRLAERLPQPPRIAGSLEELLRDRPEIVVEAASPEAVREHGERVLRAGASLVVLSVSALLDEQLLSRLAGAAAETGSRIYVPTGAIAGLDAVRAHRLAGIERLVLRTVKPPEALGLSREQLAGEARLLYRGPAREAARRYPLNLNVAAALALAAGREPTVEVYADPNASRNIHVILVEGPAGRLEIHVENVPSPENPRTSLLAALSVVELLRRLSRSDPLEVGS